MTWSSAGRRITLAGYISTIAFLVAHAINAFVAEALYRPFDFPPLAVEEYQSALQEDQQQTSVELILQSGLFTVPAVTPSQSEQQSAPPPPPMNVQQKVALLGTVFEKEAGVMAVLEEVSTKKQSLYRVGSHVPNVGTLAAIEKHRALFREGPSEEWLNLMAEQEVRAGAPGYAPPAKASPPNLQRRVLDRREVTDALADTTRLLTQAQAVPYLKDGKLDGFRLFNVTAMGFFDRLGLQANDIVQRINGVELRDPGMLLSLFQQLRNERTVRVDLVRENQRQTLTYEIR